jgi:hypothetical protein
MQTYDTKRTEAYHDKLIRSRRRPSARGALRVLALRVSSLLLGTALYFDPVNFASRIKAPVMAGMGFIDTVSPPAGIWTALNQVPGPTEPLPLIESEHDNFTPDKGRACPARTQQILDSLRAGAQYNPTVLK